MSSDTAATPETGDQTESDVELRPLGGEPVNLAQQTRLFQLMAVALDPYTDESSWILRTAARILTEYHEADCRTAWIITCGEDDAKRFLGPYADEFLTFCDEDRSVVKGLGLETLPALVTVGTNGEVIGSAEGWEPDEWREIAHEMSRILAWNSPLIPKGSDPVPFPGTPVAG